MESALTTVPMTLTFTKGSSFCKGFWLGVQDLIFFQLCLLFFSVWTFNFHFPGFVYGAKDNKRLQVFIDDLSLPPQDEGGVQRCNELLRQLLDDKALVGLEKPFEWRTIEDLVVLSAFTKSHFPSIQSKVPSERLMVRTDLSSWGSGDTGEGSRGGCG